MTEAAALGLTLVTVPAHSTAGLQLGPRLTQPEHGFSWGRASERGGGAAGKATREKTWCPSSWKNLRQRQKSRRYSRNHRRKQNFLTTKNQLLWLFPLQQDVQWKSVVMDGWNRSDRFLKTCVTFTGVRQGSPENAQVRVTERSCDLLIKNLTKMERVIPWLWTISWNHLCRRQLKKRQDRYSGYLT